MVLDTNILVSALLWRGAPYRCLLAVQAGLVDLVISPPIWDRQPAYPLSRSADSLIDSVPDDLPMWDTSPMAEVCLRSERLLLRRLRMDDAEEVVALLGNDRDAVLQMSHMPYPCTLESAREWIVLRTQPGATTFAITRAADETFLGTIGFGGLPEMPAVGYWIGRPYWSQGYATEALQLIIAHVRQVGVKGLQAETFPENPASARVLAKCGFHDRGIGRRNYPARGGLCPVHIHILHFATYDAKRAAEPQKGSLQ